jgi:hypothetical protein
VPDSNPFEETQQGGNPFEETQQPPGMLEDVRKSATAGALRAPLHMFGARGDIGALGEYIGNLWGRKLTSDEWRDLQNKIGIAPSPTTMDIAHNVERTTGLPAGYTGQTLPGRIAGGTVEGALDPLSLAAGPAGVVPRLVSGAAAGAGSSVGGEALGPLGAIAGGTLGSLATSSRLAAGSVKPAPTPADLRAAPTAGRRLPDIQADEAAAAAAERIDTALDRSSRQVHGSTANRLRNELNDIIDDPAFASMSAEQKGRLSSIVTSGKLEQWLGRYSHYGPHALAGAMASAVFGGPHGFTAAATAGALVPLAARMIDKFRTFGKTRSVRDDILRGAPSGGGVTPVPSQLPASLLRGTLSPDLSDLANQR